MVPLLPGAVTAGQQPSCRSVVPNRVDRGLGPIGHVEPGEDRLHVVLDGLLRDTECPSYMTVRHTVGQQGENLELARCQGVGGTLLAGRFTAAIGRHSPLRSAGGPSLCSSRTRAPRRRALSDGDICLLVGQRVCAVAILRSHPCLFSPVVEWTVPRPAGSVRRPQAR
jgi:hypothetical protein